LEAKRASAKSEEELRIWRTVDKRKSMIEDIANGYDLRTFSYFMEHDDFELMYKYQTDAQFRYAEMRKGWVKEG
jgi:hypothetical protein